MDRQMLLASSLLALAAFLLFRSRDAFASTQEATSVAAPSFDILPSFTLPGIDIMPNLTRGERNNNPGNIVKSNVQWQGKITGSDSRFESFDTPENGIRALSILLRNYQNRYGLNTVRGIISRFAPPSENDTGSYINSVAAALGVSTDGAINLNDGSTLYALVNAIIQHENGRVMYAADTVANSIYA